jgi:hypothetical protein
MLRILARCVLLLFVFSALAIESPSQTSATVTLEQAVFKAGEIIKGSVTLDTPLPCSGYFYIEFSSDGPGNGRELAANPAQTGSKTITVFLQDPFDDAGGDFTSDSAAIRCDGYQHPRPIAISNKVHFTIVPVPDTNVYPTHAKVELTD